MDALTVGADVATRMLTGLSVVTATIVWGEKQWREYRARKALTAERNWGGYILPGGINSWDVVLAEDPDLPTGRVVLDVVNSKGEPDVNMANNLRQLILRDGRITRAPTPAEAGFLRYLHKERGYGKGFPVE